MSIKLVPFAPGTLIKSSEANGHNNLLFNNEILTKIDQLIDRNVIRSNDKVSPFVEAYTSAGGRKGSVDIGETDSVFDSGKYSPGNFTNEAPADTTHEGGSYDVVANVFDEDLDTKGRSTGIITSDVGKTFSSKTITFCLVKVQFFNNGQGNGSVSLQTFDGSSWTTIDTISTVPEFTLGPIVVKKVFVNSACSGIRLRRSATNNSTSYLDVYTLEYGTDMIQSKILHNIPSGTFPVDTTAIRGVPFIEDWEDGASVDFKLRNDTEDVETGWLSTKQIVEFDSLGHEIEQCIVRLTPKTDDPTPGVPSIQGFYLGG